MGANPYPPTPNPTPTPTPNPNPNPNPNPHQARTELHGDVVRWGKDHRQSSAAACCAACDAHRAEAATQGRRGCNVWVWCGAASCAAQKHECWLKYTKALWETPNLLLGTSDRWTSGSADAAPAEHPSGAGIRLPVASEAH